MCSNTRINLHLNTMYMQLMQVFSLVSGSDEKYLAPGLKLPVVLQYSPRDERNHRGCLEIYMNASLILTIPITA